MYYEKEQKEFKEERFVEKKELLDCNGSLNMRKCKVAALYRIVKFR